MPKSCAIRLYRLRPNMPAPAINTTDSVVWTSSSAGTRGSMRAVPAPDRSPPERDAATAPGRTAAIASAPRPATNATTIVRVVTPSFSTTPASSNRRTLSPNQDGHDQGAGHRHRCEDCGFEQDLGKETTPRRAEGRADRKLAAALRAADEEQCRRVREPDDQDEDRHAGEGPGDPPLHRCHLAAADADERDAALDCCVACSAAGSSPGSTRARMLTTLRNASRFHPGTSRIAADMVPRRRRASRCGR